MVWRKTRGMDQYLARSADLEYYVQRVGHREGWIAGWRKPGALAWRAIGSGSTAHAARKVAEGHLATYVEHTVSADHTPASRPRWYDRVPADAIQPAGIEHAGGSLPAPVSSTGEGAPTCPDCGIDFRKSSAFAIHGPGYCAPATPPSSSLGESAVVDELQRENAEWRRLVARLGDRLGCLSSVFPDSNEHLIRAADLLTDPAYREAVAASSGSGTGEVAPDLEQLRRDIRAARSVPSSETTEAGDA